ncbi:hypothetical protein B8W72_17485 [Pseudomonas putida]|uniref:Uncharacterized protein n=1 Tax=Pseudomonas putida TaxID=303 RepID=A0A1Y3L561_PSEPU|nr:hypothetical protein [Pseudomonas putida]OUM30562.1 hypothetical protein B8W72_17485 [Pseudomonas putida]
MHAILLDHAKQNLIFYVAQDLDQSIRSDVHQLVSELAASRVWSIAPPTMVDEIDENGVEVVGGTLEIYSALPPEKLPHDVDLKNLEEVEALIHAVRDLSEQGSISFEFQLGATYVGSIEDGVIDRVLQEGLLAPWRNYLSGKS